MFSAGHRLVGLAVAVLGSMTVGHAADRVTVKTGYYAISGDNGLELYMSMVKHGPRHGMLTRAIAQTSYKIEWDAEVRSINGVCRVSSARPTLSITFTYPKPKRVPPNLQARWDRFMTGVRKHEEVHGRLARKMVEVAGQSVRGIRFSNDLNCSKTKRELKRRTDATYAKYEAQQVHFDEVEHRDGGKIDRLITALVKPK